MTKYEEKIEEIKSFVKGKYKDADHELGKPPYYYQHHIVPAYSIGCKLAKKYNADLFIVEMAILLHDLILGEKHEETGAEFAYHYLTSIGIEKDDVIRVCDCIKVHPCKEEQPKNIEEKIVSTADALAHLTTPWFIVRSYYSDHSVEDVLKWCQKKIKSDLRKIKFEDELQIAKKYCTFWEDLLDVEGKK